MKAQVKRRKRKSEKDSGGTASVNDKQVIVLESEDEQTIKKSKTPAGVNLVAPTTEKLKPKAAGRKRSSAIWNYFKETKSDEIVCLAQDCGYVVKNGNIGNAVYHFATKHSVLRDEYTEKERLRLEDKAKSVPSTPLIQLKQEIVGKLMNPYPQESDK